MSISCVIPSIGRPELIDVCLHSVFEQTIKFDEVIVVSDSSDFTCLNMDGVTFLFTGGGRGGPYARDLGYNNSSSDLVVFLDDDDYLAPNFNENLRKIDIENVSLIVPNVYKIWTEGRIPAMYSPAPQSISGYINFQNNTWLPSTSSGLIFNRGIVRKLPINPKIKGFNDVQMIFGASKFGEVYFSKESKVYFVQYFSKERLTSNFNDRMKRLEEATCNGLEFSLVQRELIIKSAIFSSSRNIAYTKGFFPAVEFYRSKFKEFNLSKEKKFLVHLLILLWLYVNAKL